MGTHTILLYNHINMVTVGSPSLWNVWCSLSRVHWITPDLANQASNILCVCFSLFYYLHALKSMGSQRAWTPHTISWTSGCCQLYYYTILINWSRGVTCDPMDQIWNSAIWDVTWDWKKKLQTNCAMGNSSGTTGQAEQTTVCQIVTGVHNQCDHRTCTNF